jgi:hypothetical protein
VTGGASSSKTDLQDPEPLDAVEQRHPQPVTALAVRLEHLDGTEAAAGERAVDRQPLGHQARGAAQSAQRALVVVDEPQDRGRRAQVACAELGQLVERVGGHEVGAAQDGVQRGGVRAGEVPVHQESLPRPPGRVCPATWGEAPRP